MSWIDFITQHTLLVAIIVIIIFLLYQFYLKPKYFTGIKVDQGLPEAKPVYQSIPTEKDTTPARIRRGFGVMKNKIADSDFIKNIHSQQEDDGPDPFATDFSKMGQVDF